MPVACTAPYYKRNKTGGGGRAGGIKHEIRKSGSFKEQNMKTWE